MAYVEPILRDFQNPTVAPELRINYGNEPARTANGNGKAADGVTDLVVDLWNGAANGDNSANPLMLCVIHLGAIDFANADETYTLELHMDASAVNVLAAPERKMAIIVTKSDHENGKVAFMVRPDRRYASLRVDVGGTTPSIVTGPAYLSPVTYAR